MAIKEFFKKVWSAPPTTSQPAQVTSESATNLLQRIREKVAGGWGAKFVTDIYNEKVLYPHEEMDIAKKAFRYNAWIQAAIVTRRNFLLGGAQEIISQDKATQAWVSDYLRMSGLQSAFARLGEDLPTVGMFYAERIMDGQKIVAHEYLPHPERVYHMLDEKGIIQFYVLEVPESYTRTDVQQYSINYYGSMKKAVRGIRIEKSKIFMVKFGVSEIPSYGRGYVASVCNDVKILLELERAMAIYARYKSIPKYFISMLDANGPKDADYLSNQLRNLSDTENPIWPGDIKLQKMSYDGADMNLQTHLDYLKKKITIALAPSFLMHGDETNYAVSKDQRTSFQLAINTERAIINEAVKKEVIIAARSQGVALRDFDIQFGDFDLGQEAEKQTYAVSVFNAGLINLDEAREILGFEKDAQYGLLYSHDLKAQSDLFGGASNGQVDPDAAAANEKYQTTIHFKEQQKGAEIKKETDMLESELTGLMRQKELNILDEKRKLVERLRADLDAST
jgi:hypothetical protein